MIASIIYNGKFIKLNSFTTVIGSDAKEIRSFLDIIAKAANCTLCRDCVEVDHLIDNANGGLLIIENVEAGCYRLGRRHSKMQRMVNEGLQIIVSTFCRDWVSWCAPDQTIMVHGGDAFYLGEIDVIKQRVSERHELSLGEILTEIDYDCDDRLFELWLAAQADKEEA